MIMQTPLIVGIAGIVLSETERRVLKNPLIQGVILFTRNYQNKLQLKALCDELHQLRAPALRLYVDQEGGRVQRFREDFMALTPLGDLGLSYQASKAQALKTAYQHAYIMASELLNVGVDQSFAPVVDLDRGSRVIGNRAFSSDIDAVIALAEAYINGMQAAGMPAILKHYPGHGSVAPDTHFEFAVDERSFAELTANDLQPFKALLGHTNVVGVMVAHVIYPEIDAQPASLSKRWLQDILRQKLGFKGAIFSDDLGMQAVSNLDRPEAIVTRALSAGCDHVLLCNDWQVSLQVLQGLMK
jgi:beta-N-acetylhexosaminidase